MHVHYVRSVQILVWFFRFASNQNSCWKYRNANAPDKKAEREKRLNELLEFIDIKKMPIQMNCLVVKSNVFSCISKSS